MEKRIQKLKFYLKIIEKDLNWLKAHCNFTVLTERGPIATEIAWIDRTPDKVEFTGSSLYWTRPEVVLGMRFQCGEFVEYKIMQPIFTEMGDSFVPSLTFHVPS